MPEQPTELDLETALKLRQQLRLPNMPGSHKAFLHQARTNIQPLLQSASDADHINAHDRQVYIDARSDV